MRSGRSKRRLPRRRYRRQTGRNGQKSAAIPRESAHTPAAESGSVSPQGRTYCVMALPQTGAAVQVRASAEAAAVRECRSSDVSVQAVGAGLRVRSAARVLTGLLLTAAIILSPLWLTTDSLLPIMKQLSAASASMRLEQDGQTGGVAEGEIIEPDIPRTTSVTSQTTTLPTTAATTAAATAENTEGLLPVSEQQLGNSGTRVGDIYVKNSTGYSPDFEKLLTGRADCKIKLNAGYQVLIVHTHTTECYAGRTDGVYDPDYSPRTTDTERSVVAVGDVLAQQLEAVGIRTLHAVEMHDHPQYNGSYDRALDTIEKYLEQYPTIEMVLDVHRDAITYDDGTKLKPTAVINGRSAAQVMIITGCDAGGSLYFPEWQKNLCMALQIQQSAQSSFSGLMRPLSFAPYRYNMHMTPNSLLLEFGTDANTLDEALYSAELAGKAIAEVLLNYVV